MHIVERRYIFSYVFKHYFIFFPSCFFFPFHFVLFLFIFKDSSRTELKAKRKDDGSIKSDDSSRDKEKANMWTFVAFVMINEAREQTKKKKKKLTTALSEDAEVPPRRSRFAKKRDRAWISCSCSICPILLSANNYG